jgi:hypothetical protein
MGIDIAALRAWVELTCAAQGIPVAVTDSATVFRVGVLLSGRDAADSRGATDAATVRSQLPSGNDSVHVDASST